MDAGEQLSRRARWRQRSLLRLLGLGAVLLALLPGCGGGVFNELRIHVPAYREFSATALRAIFEEQSRVRIVGVVEGRDVSALDALHSDLADLALVENSTPFSPGIRAVLPVFESVLHILVADDFQPGDMNRPMQGATIHVMNRSDAGREFVRLVTRRQGLRPGDYTLSDDFVEGDTDVVIYFGPIEPELTHWFRDGFSLISLDHEYNPGRQFFQEGIGYSAPNMKPAVIPAQTYFSLPGNEDALHTVAVDTLLVTRADMPLPVIFELTRTFIEQKPRFVAVAPQLFAGINESFDPLDLNFPLHDGARRYLMRDEPGLLERYAETINLLVYLVFLLLTGVVALARWRAQLKKDRIDHFYAEVLAVRDRIDSDDPRRLLQELDELEREAFNKLIREKLAANESFRIFIDLMERQRRELHERLEQQA